MAYRTDTKKKLYQELEQLAVEEEAAELEQIARDLDACSKAEEAEVRLHTKGISLTENESRAEAKEYVDKLLQDIRKSAKKKKESRKQLFEKIKRVGKYVGIAATAVAVVGGPVYATAYYWNSGDEALAALAKYDKPVKITDPQEREAVISQLDEIFEKHAPDAGSDRAAATYFSYLESKGVAISEGAKRLDAVGNWVPISKNYVGALENSIYQYDMFLEAKKISPKAGECLLKHAEACSDDLLIRLIEFYNAGVCKNE